MMRWIKGGILLAVGVIILGLGFISAVNFSFDWENSMPSSIILAVIFIPTGGAVLVQGLITLEAKAPSNPGESQNSSSGAPR